ncbi:hypothetical protein F4778DRAFT_2907 [Xylariomycetidae sp. FL2044]|nr:hypothetical protein F4778DRAFT_2907 [Xylariomycetidae sp. FL2044]
MSEVTEADIKYLLSLQAVRDRSKIVFAAAEKGQLNSFDYDAQKLQEAADVVIQIMNRDWGPDRFSQIPPHGRWQHFDVGGDARMAPLLEQWTAEGCDKTELTRRLVDLFFVSVLLDAGAGDTWKFKEPGTGQSYGRSEGTAVASLYMFTSGAFSGSAEKKPIVTAAGLADLTETVFCEHFQVTPDNAIVGPAARTSLLNAVGRSLLQLPEIVGAEGRPGNMVDYLIKSSKEAGTLDYELLWSTLQAILIPSWPSNRPSVAGKPVGDAWRLKILADNATKESDAIAPFHKLTQWLGYSLMVPFTRILGFRLVNDDLGTGLPEYRNGGLFVDLGVLRLKPALLEQGLAAPGARPYLPLFPATGDTIAEWRAMTVALLDQLFGIISAHFAERGVKLSMAQMLEAGTWLGGRELARKLRPQTMSSPILNDSDGTLF